MTRIFVAGHSDSAATYLGDGELPWTERSRAWLEERTGRPCELGGVRFAPMGGRAVQYLMAAVEEAQPDIVVIPFTAYVCTIGTVESSVRARFGARAARYFSRAEGKFHASTRKGRARRKANTVARTVARRVLGTRPLATVEQTAAIYEEILHRLARIESLQVVVVADARFSEEVQRREPKLHLRMDQMYATLLPVAERHHFVVADLEGRLEKGPARRKYYQPDGVHTTAAFHDVYFEVMQEALSKLPLDAPTPA